MSNIKRRLDRVLANINQPMISKKAFDEFKKITPKDTGNARRKTKLRGNIIKANYRYATVLDKGRHMTRKGMRGSNQAPEGMSKPTIKSIREFIYRTLGIRV